MQVASVFLLGYAVDFFNWLLIDFPPDIYWLRVLSVVVGSFFMSVGVFFTLVSKFAVLPGDGFVLALDGVIKRKFGETRIISDVSMSVIAAAIRFFTFGGLAGAREGTLVASLPTGFYVGLLLKGANALKNARHR